MFATLSTAWILPGILGPAIAGVVAEAFNWRWIFFGLLPLLAFSGSMAYRGLPNLVRRSLRDRAASSSGSRIRDGLDRRHRRRGGWRPGWRSNRPCSSQGSRSSASGSRSGRSLRLVPPGTLRAARGYPTAILLRGVLTFAFFSIDVYVALLLDGGPRLVRGRRRDRDHRGDGLVDGRLVDPGAPLRARSRTSGSSASASPSSRSGSPASALVLLPEVPAWFAVPIFALGGFGMGLTYAQFALIVLRDVPPRVAGRGDRRPDALGLARHGARHERRRRRSCAPRCARATARPRASRSRSRSGTVAALIGWVLAPRLLPEGARGGRGSAAGGRSVERAAVDSGLAREAPAPPEEVRASCPPRSFGRRSARSPTSPSRASFLRHHDPAQGRGRVPRGHPA